MATVTVRYIVEDVDAAIEFYSKQPGSAESGVRPQHRVAGRRRRTGPDSDQIPRRRRTRLARDDQTDLDLDVLGSADPVVDESQGAVLARGLADERPLPRGQTVLEEAWSAA